MSTDDSNDRQDKREKGRKQKDLFAAHDSDSAASPPRKGRTRDLARNLHVHLSVDADEADDKETHAPGDEEDTGESAGERRENAPPRSTSVNLEFDSTATPALEPPEPLAPSRARLHPAPQRRSRGSGAEGPDADSELLTVSQLTGRLRRSVERSFGDVWVVGEVAGLSARSHRFFTLKDDAARLKCVMWASDAARLRFEVKDGLDVLVRGRLSMYEPHGQVQLYVTHMQPQGIGALQLAYEQLKERLATEGLFAEERKRPLPFLPRRVGVITSRHGAALRDVMQTLRARFPGMPLLLADARVQGEGAVAELVDAIRKMNRYVARGGVVDVLLITRGGGSYEDLVAFNDESVARAIAASRIPTVSAVGHEVDTTIADLVADRRGTTPTDGARLVVPERGELERRVRLAQRRLQAVIRHRLHAAQATVREAQSRLERSSPHGRLRGVRHRLDVLDQRFHAALSQRLGATQNRLDRAREALLHLDPARALLPRLRERLGNNERRLHRAMRLYVQQRRDQLAAAAQALEAYSPLKVLARGYSVTLSSEGQALLDASDAQVGEEIHTRLHRGHLRSRITALEPPSSPEPPEPLESPDEA